MIVGAGGHGAAVAEALNASGAFVQAFVDPNRRVERTRLGIPIQSEAPSEHIERGNPIAIAIGDNSQRERVSRSLYERGATARNFPAICHPSASVSTLASLREGAVILQGASVGPGSVIGRFCVVATAAVVARDGRMADFSFVSANTVLGASLLG